MVGDANNTSGKFASGINDTGGKFASGIVDTWYASPIENNLREFSKKFKMTLVPFTHKSWSKLKQGSFLTFQKSRLSKEEKTSQKKKNTSTFETNTSQPSYNFCNSDLRSLGPGLGHQESGW